jgi:hypothetical protein
VHHARVGLRVGGELVVVHPQHGEATRRVDEVRHPRAHEVEHLTADVELFVQRADRGDGGVVDVGDEPQRTVERVVGAGIGPVEEPGREVHVWG